MTGLDAYTRSPHGDLGVGKRPDELDWKKPDPFDLTTGEAAVLAGVSADVMIAWVRRGKVDSARRGGRYFLRRRDVELLAEQRRLPS